ncbi:mechanosensitive ion channel family protein [Lachnoanaerobaculum umeaense]|jgi:small-conductance mechanosensitive channel|uniref:Mechanosensitive ion channel family protein n=1 Tax=Lachnoanaerobaculum umeaense TaxID=617123 RepID=A0A385Q4W4_9FIRM|nr:mechanosensitive ion channel family protein [Lachnoanaerobaculum umeaense]AYB00848.1 mechanosensitive ion channel family protein [Lachnoanaerobaculum umeaense]
MGTGICLTSVANSGLPTISESEVAQSLAEDIEKLKPSVFIQTLKSLSPYLLALAYNIVIIIITLIIASQVIKIISRMLEKFFKKINIDVTVRRFLLSTLKVLFYALVVLVLAERMGINQASVVAILGSAGVALGLAWQGSLSNFAGGMIILFSRPFSRGDYIITPKAEGIVDTIGIIYTILLTPDNKRISIPNGALANDVITNVTANDIRRIDIQVGVSYNTDIRKAKKLIKEAFDENGLVVKNKEIITYVSDLASSAVILGGRAWCKTEDYWTARWGIIEEIKVKFDKSGIEIPYDQLEVHINESRNSKNK